jgi:hypothetical protein
MIKFKKKKSIKTQHLRMILGKKNRVPTKYRNAYLKSQ